MKVFGIEHSTNYMYPRRITSTGLLLGSQVGVDELKQLQVDGWKLFVMSVPR